jgi:hypothetical protein
MTNLQITKTKPEAVSFLEQHDYLQNVIEDIEGLDKKEQIDVIHDWLNDVDDFYELGNSFKMLNKHAKQVYKYLKNNS